jgi:hypothetical protein
VFPEPRQSLLAWIPVDELSGQPLPPPNLGLRPAPEFEAWLEPAGVMSDADRLLLVTKRYRLLSSLILTGTRTPPLARDETWETRPCATS